MTDSMTSQMSTSAPNAVEALRHRIATEFVSKKRASEAIVADDSLLSVRYFLDCIGWSGSDRRFFEAQPYLDAVNELNALRTFLFKLDFSTTLASAERTKLRDAFLPCFLIDDANRLRVIRSIDAGGDCSIFDPTTGQLEQKAKATLRGTLVFPEATAEKGPAAAAEKWTGIALRAFGKDLRMIFLVSFLVNMFLLALPIYIMNVYDKAIGTGATDILLWLSVGICFIIAADLAFKTIKAKLQARLASRLDQQASTAIFRQLMFLPLSFVENSAIGDQMTRIRQMGAFRDAFTGALVNAIFDLPFLVLFLLAIYLVAGPIVLVPVVLIVLFGLLAMWSIPASNRAVREVGQARIALQNLSIEMVTNHDQIQQLGCQSVFLEQYRDASARAAAASHKMRQFNLVTETIAQGLVTISGVATLSAGALMAMAGTLSVGALIACMALAWKVLNPIRGMFLSGLVLGQTIQSFRQIDRLMGIQPEREPERAPTVSQEFTGQIEFDRVAFRFNSKRQPALRQLSFKIEPREFIAVCGPSGAGKTTMIKTLLGLYQPQSGLVRVNGINLRQINLGAWRQNVGTALEVADFYHGTIAQNIRLAHPEASDAEIDAIARRFGLDAYYGHVLDEGLNTRMSHQNLARWPDALTSRISLCRAFIKQNAILVLDNPADTLDFDGEASLKAELERARHTSTIIMTTHRPSLMRLADKVLWIEDGMVAGFDTPDLIVPKFLATYTSHTPGQAVQAGSKS
ncbi:MAG: ABC transporter transmembrane domain-containing protein [Pseudomonadota bacterium]